jgi:hypothetical protein
VLHFNHIIVLLYYHVSLLLCASVMVLQFYRVTMLWSYVAVLMCQCFTVLPTAHKEIRA